MFEFIDTGENTGEFNMAYDMELTEKIKNSDKSFIRVYQWKPYAISLGYNQILSGIDEDLCKKAGVDIVRRPTGGRAVFHIEELTYSVVMKNENGSISSTYRFISEILLKSFSRYHPLLAEYISFEKAHINMKEHYTKQQSFVCFSASALNEIKANGKKLVGSAQRRMGNILLQHGSILLNNKHKEIVDFLKDERLKRTIRKILDENTISFEEILGKPVDLEKLKECIKTEFLSID